MPSLPFHPLCVWLIAFWDGLSQCEAPHSIHWSSHHILHACSERSGPFLALSVPSKEILILLAVTSESFLCSFVHLPERLFFGCCMILLVDVSCFRSLFYRTKSCFEIAWAQLLWQESIHPFLDWSKHFLRPIFISLLVTCQQIVPTCQWASSTHFWDAHFAISFYW